MLNVIFHRKKMYEILKEIYSSNYAKNLAFKGGTLCYFIHSLDRFSTDLDFNLIGDNDEEKLFEEIKKILENKGIIKESYNKRFTLFFLLSYGESDMNIKIEINKRNRKNNKYEILNFFGTDITVMDKSSIFANKLVALTDRKIMVNRDLYDIYFFYKNNFPINEALILERTGKKYKDYLKYILDFIKTLDSKKLLSGLGEVLDNKQKAFVKDRLLKELIGIIEFNLKFSFSDVT